MRNRCHFGLKRYAVTLLALALPTLTVGGAHAQVTQPQLRAIVQENMKEDGLKGWPPDLTLRNGILRCTRLPRFDYIAISSDEWRQYQIEGLRNALTNDEKKAFWGPYIERLESILAEKMDYERIAGRTAPDGKLLAQYEQRIEATYNEAFRDLAGRLGVRLEQAPSLPAPPFCSMELKTETGRGSILLMPRTKHKIAMMSEHEPDFREYRSGAKISHIGTYVYKIRNEDGSETPVKTITIGMTGRGGSTIVLR